jgi:hypothetical protein
MSEPLIRIGQPFYDSLVPRGFPARYGCGISVIDPSGQFGGGARFYAPTPEAATAAAYDYLRQLVADATALLEAQK